MIFQKRAFIFVIIKSYKVIEDIPLLMYICINKFSKLCKGDASFPEIIKYQEEIIAVYNKFLVEEGTKRSFIRTGDGRIKFIGGPKITMDKAQFVELKSTISKIRNEIVN